MGTDEVLEFLVDVVQLMAQLTRQLDQAVGRVTFFGASGAFHIQPNAPGLKKVGGGWVRKREEGENRQTQTRFCQ